MKINKKDQIVLYTDKNGNVELHADVEKDTLWATQAQISRLFDTERSVVTKHINNILKNDEVDQKSNVQKMHISSTHRPPILYSLDIILAVGYRTNSNKAISFRKWATNVLREYIVNGFSVNRRKISSSSEALDGLHEAVALLESKDHKGKVKGKIRLIVTKDLEPIL
jgi:hypothetical protein